MNLLQNRTLKSNIIEKMRINLKNQKTEKEVKPTVENVATIVNDILQGAPFKETFSKMPGKTQKAKKEFTLNIITKFGTWLAHVEGAIKTTAVTENYDLLDLVESIETKTAKTIEVIIPPGYLPKNTGNKDYTASIASIIAHSPENSAVERFVSRTYRTRSSDLTYPLIAGVWMFAKLKRLENVDLVSDDLVFHKKVVAAYDLLEIAISDSQESLATIVNSDVKRNRRKIINACVKNRWVSESLFKEIEKSLRDKKYETASRLIRHLESRSNLFPRTISDLTAGNVRKICEYSGIPVEHTGRVDETPIRHKLKDLGFAKDSDYLLADALKAYQKGLEAEFWEIMYLRHQGDSAWVTKLDELVQ